MWFITEKLTLFNHVKTLLFLFVSGRREGELFKSLQYIIMAERGHFFLLLLSKSLAGSVFNFFGHSCPSIHVSWVSRLCCWSLKLWASLVVKAGVRTLRGSLLSQIQWIWALKKTTKVVASKCKVSWWPELTKPRKGTNNKKSHFEYPRWSQLGFLLKEGRKNKWPGL